MTDYIVRVVRDGKDTATHYATKAEALTAAVLAWDEQNQTGGFVAVYEDNGYIDHVVMAFEDRSRKALEALIPQIEEVNYFLVNLQVQCDLAEDNAKRRQLGDIYDAQARRITDALKTLSGAGFPVTSETEEIEVERIDGSGAAVTDYFEQFTFIRVGRWAYHVQEKSFFDMRPEGDFPAPRPSTFEPIF